MKPWTTSVNKSVNNSVSDPVNKRVNKGIRINKSQQEANMHKTKTPIVVLDTYTLNPGDFSWEPLEALGQLVCYERTPTDQVHQRINGSSYIFTNKTPLSRETLLKNPQLEFIGILATGYNVIDLDTAKEMGITVCNVPTYGTDAVAQYVFALLLALCHRVELHDATVKNGEWVTSQDFCYWKSPLMELAGKTMGLIGFGRIGRRTAQLAKAFGMHVVAYDKHTTPGSVIDGTKILSLEDVYQTSDVISLHVPLFEGPGGTAKMINQEAIARMKPNAIIINTARGGLIDETALAEALNQNRIAAAAVDVVSHEPMLATNPLLEAKNILITPHIAWAPVEARERLLGIAAENLKAYLEGRPQNKV
jgi:glycerate dehydrogenase